MKQDKEYRSISLSFKGAQAVIQELTGTIQGRDKDNGSCSALSFMECGM